MPAEAPTPVEELFGHIDTSPFATSEYTLVITTRARQLTESMTAGE